MFFSGLFFVYHNVKGGFGVGVGVRGMGEIICQVGGQQ